MPKYRIFFIGILMITMSSVLWSQTAPNSFETEKINGVYQPYKKTFSFFESNPHPIEDTYLKYYADQFVNGYSVVKKETLLYDTLKDDGKEIQVKEVKFGLIDTLGNLHLPCIYENLYAVENDKNANSFYTNSTDSIFIIDRSGKSIKNLPKKTKIWRRKIEGEIEYSQRTRVLGAINNGSYIRISYYDRYQLIDVYNKKLILATPCSDCIGNIGEEEKYHLTHFNDRFALYSNTPSSVDNRDINMYGYDFDLYGKSLDYKVYDFHEKAFSNSFKLAGFYNDTLVFLQDTLGNSFLTSNPAEPQNIYGFEYIEAFPEEAFYYSFSMEIMGYGILGDNKRFSPHLCVTHNGKYGLIDLDSNILIPFEYDNLYRIDAGYYWVKKGKFWAISTSHHHIVSDFAYVDIDKMNEVVFDNFMFYTRLNPRIIGREYHKFVCAHDSEVNMLSQYGGLLKRFEYSHNYYTCLKSSVLYARMEDGMYHILKPTIVDSQRLFFSPDSIAYDNIFIAPGYQIGYQLGEKYGYSPDEISYDRILLDLDVSKVYKFYGSYSKRIYVSKELYVKRGKVYGHRIDKQNKRYYIRRYRELTWP